MLPLRQPVVDAGLECGVQYPRTQQNHHQTNVHDGYLVLLIGHVTAKQRRNNKRNRLCQAHQTQCERVVRGFVQLITYNHFLNADRGGEKEGIGYKKPEIRIAERCVRIVGCYCFQVSVLVLQKNNTGAREECSALTEN